MSIGIFSVTSARAARATLRASAGEIAHHPMVARGLRVRPALQTALGTCALLALFTWAPLTLACDLAIVIDHSGSMGDARRADGHTRCADAACYAATVFNHYRCGASSCQVTTAATPVNILIDGTIPSFDIVYNDPSNGCSSIAGKRVNVFAFNSLSGLSSVTLGITADSEGWVNLSNDAAADTVLSRIHGLETGCSDSSPLADAMCGMAPLGNPALTKKKMKVLTDGGNNASVGPCSGTDDSDGLPPFDTTSWQGKVFNRFVSAPGSSWSIDTTVLTPSSTAQSLAVSRIDHETGQLLSAAQSSAADSAFFNGLSNTTGGKGKSVTDDASIVAPCGGATAAPWSPWPWTPVGLGLLLGLGGLGVLRKPRKGQASAARFA